MQFWILWFVGEDKFRDSGAGSYHADDSGFTFYDFTMANAGVSASLFRPLAECAAAPAAIRAARPAPSSLSSALRS